MEKSKRRIINEKYNKEYGYVCFFNDGEIKYITGEEFKSLNNIFINFTADPVMTLDIVSERLIKKTELDNVSLDLDLGIIYRKKDVDDNNNIKPYSLPLIGLVAYKEGNSRAYKDGESLTTGDVVENDKVSYGIMKYPVFLLNVLESRFSYDGPKTYIGLANKILSGEPFDINFSIFPMEKENQKKLIRK